MADIATILSGSGNQWAANTQILFPDDDGFADATKRWAIHKPPTYAAVIRPATEEDVVKVVSPLRRGADNFCSISPNADQLASYNN